MCVGLAYRQALQRPNVFFRCSGQVPLVELLCIRYALKGDAHVSTWRKVQITASTLLGTVYNRAICHSAALHANMHPTASQGNTNAKGSFAPVWIDCDAGSDDALGTRMCLLINISFLHMHTLKDSNPAGILLAARANIVGISSVRGNTVGRNTARSCTDPIQNLLTKCPKLARMQSKCRGTSSGF